MRLNKVDSYSLGERNQQIDEMYGLFGRGKVFYVDPYAAGTGNQGTKKNPVDNIYDLHANTQITSGQGDRIIVYSGGTTTANTTSYLDIELPWSYYNTWITGVASPTFMFGRARVSSKERTTGAITTLSFADTNGVYTIEDSAAAFVTNGFVVGAKVDVTTTSGTNDGQYTVTAVAAGALTVTESVTTENAATAGSSTVLSYQANLMTVSGDNNLIQNIHFANYGTTTNSAGAVKVSGNRNTFLGCHFFGMGHATAAANASGYDVMLDGAQETTFNNCVLGSDTIIRAAANGNLLIDGSSYRAQFNNCTFISYSETNGKGAVKSADATSMQGVFEFNDCHFINWNPNGITTSDDVFAGTSPTSGACVVSPNSYTVGYDGWGAYVYVAGAAAAASAAGQIATTE